MVKLIFRKFEFTKREEEIEVKFDVGIRKERHAYTIQLCEPCPLTLPKIQRVNGKFFIAFTLKNANERTRVAKILLFGREIF